MLEGLEAVEVPLSKLEFSNRIDSEYYRKEFLLYENIIKNIKHTELQDLASFLIGPFGSAFDTENYVANGEFRYVRGQDVKPFILKDGENRYLPESDFNRLSKYALRERDILVSVVGTLGNACIVQAKELPAIFSCKSTVVRTNKINPVYLLSFLNSKYGHSLLLRKERGAIQKGLNLDDLKTILVPLPEVEFQNQIENIFYLAQDKLEECKQTFKNAELTLFSSLNLSQWQPIEKNTTVKKFSKSFAISGRLDAEYYQPKYDEVLQVIGNATHKTLGSIATFKKSIEPGSDAYQTEGISFIRVSDISKFGLSQPEIHLDRKEFDLAELKPKKDTILLSKDGSVGIAYKVEQDLDVITSSALLHLTITDKEVLPDYLTLVLNSKLTQMQAERDAGGSIIQHWRPEEIKQVLIPVLPMDTQKELTKQIKQSFKLRQESTKLIDIAKQAVEIAIEQDEKIAMKFIKDNRPLS